MSLLEDLQWRYATKRMNRKTIPKDKINYILEIARLAPSSMGLQPYKIFIISSSELKEKIKLIANNQDMISEASHILVFAAWNKYTEERINDVFSRVISERGLQKNAMDNYKSRLLRKYNSESGDLDFQHASKQTYISLGLAIAAAAELKIDSTPIEGFDSEALDEFLKFKQIGLRSTVLLALGYRDEENDWLLQLKKVRTPKEKFITEIN
jgi:nitroreductase / dihydropteridine reductase